MDDDPFRAYADAAPPEHRPLLERVHRLVLHACPDATVGISYGMPTYRYGGRRLYLGAWSHGVSLYGWSEGGDGGFAGRHPETLSGRGTIRLTPEAADRVSDDELVALARAVLVGPGAPAAP